MRILVVIVLLVIAYETNADSRVCGESLDQTMMLLCGPTGFHSKLKKSVGLSGSTGREDDTLNALADIFLSDEENFMTKIRRRRSGIADECCTFKGCSFNELLSYCKR